MPNCSNKPCTIESNNCNNKDAEQTQEKNNTVFVHVMYEYESDIIDFKQCK